MAQLSNFILNFNQDTATIATYTFTSTGWTTFGFVSTQGAAFNGLQIGRYPTQTDVKTRWPDGSIKHAVLTANIISPGSAAIKSSQISSGTPLVPTWPTASVDLNIGGTVYSAVLPVFTGTDSWLSGAQVRESRVVVIPTAPGPISHPLLQVVYDVRCYSDGSCRLDVCTQNMRDSTVMAQVLYDLSITVNSSVVFTSAAVTSYAFTRWRKVLNVGLTLAAYTPDFESAHVACMLPRIWPSVQTVVYPTGTTSPITASWDINGFCSMTPDMDAPGYSPYLSPVTGPQAEYIAHKTANEFDAITRQGNCAGSWSSVPNMPDGVTPIKCTNPAIVPSGVVNTNPFNVNYSYYTISAGFNLSAFYPGPQGPADVNGLIRGYRSGALADVPSAAMNDQHVYNLTYVPYIVTGDRYYLDIHKSWVAWSIFEEQNKPGNIFREPVIYPTFNQSRNLAGGIGRVWVSGLSRELGHKLLIIVQAGVMVPDADPDQSYYRTVAQSNLDGLATFTTTYLYNVAHPGLDPFNLALACGFGRTDNLVNGVISPPVKRGLYVGFWRNTYTATAIDYAAQSGIYTIGHSTDYRDITTNTFINFYLQGTALGFPAYTWIPGYPTVAHTPSGDDSTVAFYTSWSSYFGDNIDGGFNWTDFQDSSGAIPPGHIYHSGGYWQSFSSALSFVGEHDAEAMTVASIAYRDNMPSGQTYYLWLKNFAGVQADLNARPGYTAVFSRVALP